MKAVSSAARRIRDRSARVPPVRPAVPESGAGGNADLLRLLNIPREGVSIERELALELGRSYHLMFRWMSDTLTVLKLTPQQYGILEVLAHSPRGTAQDDLRVIFLCSKPNMSGLVERLVSSRLVKRVRDAGDKRRRILTLTSNGRAILRKARPIYRGAVTNFFAPMRVASRRQLLELIREIRVPLEKTAPLFAGEGGS